MSIDVSTIKPGGKVSVTLTDGTRIIDSPVTAGAANLGETLTIADGCIVLRNALDHLTVRIASIDEYYPPSPAWDRPEVFAVTDATGRVWSRVGDMWTTGTSSYGSPSNLRTAEKLDRRCGPCTALAVYAEGVLS